MTLSPSAAELLLAAFVLRAELSNGDIEKVTKVEIGAIKVAIEALKRSIVDGDNLSSEHRSALTVLDVVPPLNGNPPAQGENPSDCHIELSIEGFELSEPIDLITVCVDFGTAASKAFAMDGWDSPVDLPLGRIAGSRAPYPVESSVFITDQGFILFGPKAVEESDRAVEVGRRRFDSIKSRFNAGTEVDIAKVPIGAAINPLHEHYPLTEADVVTLYLAYLGSLVGAALEEKGFSRYTRRRYARPCWSAERRQWADPLMRDLMAKGQILADTFRERLISGVSVRDAWDALDQLRKLDSVKVSRFRELLLSEDLAEPVAAAAPYAVMQEKGWQFILVVDVGAGTTDLGLFLVQAVPNMGDPIIRTIPGSIRYVNAAGDLIDNLLKSFVLKTEGIDPHTPAGEQAAAQLTNFIRRYKETLYRDEIVEIPLGDGSSCVVDLQSFIRTVNVGRFTSRIKDEIQAVFDNVDGTYVRRASQLGGVKVILTGGGGSLPMVQEAVAGPFIAHGCQIRTYVVSPLPSWAVDNEIYTQIYAQLAVAAGGSSPELPTEGRAFDRPAFQ